MDQDISKFVAVCASRRRRDSKYKFERRQIPLDIDDSLTVSVPTDNDPSVCWI